MNRLPHIVLAALGRLWLVVLLLLLLTVLPIQTTTATTTPLAMMIIDSHVHVWASTEEQASFPYAAGQEPPETLRNQACVSHLLEQQQISGVDGALIVQPINHQFDHSYVLRALQERPTKFKGMLLFDPSLDPETAVATLEDLVLKGFVGVRFNPYLWKQREDGTYHKMSEGAAGLAVYQRCGELRIPVGVMCFQGLQHHYDDILQLLKTYPETPLIVDHFGFTTLTTDDEGDQAMFQQLLTLAAFPQVTVKISALFRLGDTYPFERVRRERFDVLVQTFGPDRLLMGTDFPFCLDQNQIPSMGYAGAVALVKEWCQDERTAAAILGGTASRLFGPWGYSTTKTTDDNDDENGS